jgi:hypothetical protein
MKDQNSTERRSSMDPAEGSREDMRGSSSSGERGRSSSSERGKGSSSERGMGSSSGMRSGSSDSGGISNRERSREECEQDQLPERGKSSDESSR